VLDSTEKSSELLVEWLLDQKQTEKSTQSNITVEKPMLAGC
jgi:hypothetical protein